MYMTLSALVPDSFAPFVVCFAAKGDFLYNVFMTIINLINILDIWTMSFAKSIRTNFLTLFFKTITYLGEWSVLLVVAILVSTILITKRKKKYDVLLALISFSGLGIVFLLKNFIHRERPLNGLVNESSFSFPSAHALMSVVFYGFIIYLLWPNMKSTKIKTFKIFFGLILVLLIGFSRVYLGVHYLSDVLGGYIIGAVLLVIGIYGSKLINRRKF